MIREVFMPALSSTMTEGKIVSWVKAPGDKIDKGETVVIVESDKADMDVESFYEGFLAAIVVEAGDVAPVGHAIALLAETEAEIEAAKAQAASVSSGAAAAPAAPSTPTATTATTADPVATAPQNGSVQANRPSGRVVVSPRARKLAKELKVDLATVQGSGPHGRVVAEDIERAAGKPPTAAAPVPPTPVPPTPVAPTQSPTPLPQHPPLPPPPLAKWFPSTPCNRR